MAAYRRVDNLSHLRSDCLYTGISSGPNAQLNILRCRLEGTYLY